MVAVGVTDLAYGVILERRLPGELLILEI